MESLIVIVLALLCITSASLTSIPPANNDRTHRTPSNHHHHHAQNIRKWTSPKYPKWVANMLKQYSSDFIEEPVSDYAKMLYTKHMVMDNAAILPTHEPTPEPTPRPSPSPTTLSTQINTYPGKLTTDTSTSYIENICKYVVKNGLQTDFVVLFDTSCHIKHTDCKSLLEGVSNIISKLMLPNSDTLASNRVQTMQMKGRGHPKILVSFNDVDLQNNAEQYTSFIRGYEQCDHPQKSTNIVKALGDAEDWFNLKDDRKDTIIIINICRDDRTETICNRIAPYLSDKGIDTYIVNLIDASNAGNVITTDEAYKYLKCIANNDVNHVCIGDDEKGVSVKEFDDIIGNCLLPQICIPKKPMANDVESSVMDEDTVYPTPEPTPRPSPSPTLIPTDIPTYIPTSEPTLAPIAFSGCEGELDIVIFVDNSCRLKTKVCDRLLKGIGEIVYSVLDYPLVRVATVQFGGYGHSLKILIGFDDVSLQKHPGKYVKYMKENGECTECGFGDTNLYYALRRAKQIVDDERRTKFVIVSVCKDMDKVCEIREEFEEKGIDLYVVNLIGAGSNDNVIVDEEDAKDYLLCLTENDPGRVCVPDKSGVTVQIFDDIIEGCLLPQICESN